jgi:ribonuclease BN (tRNA processing enzyme)
VDTNTKVVLLGVGGGPGTKKIQHGISQVIVGGKVYLADCGTGLCEQLHKAGLLGSLRQSERLHRVFLTHMHLDHTIDYFSHLFLAAPDHEINACGPGRPDQMPREFRKR